MEKVDKSKVLEFIKASKDPVGKKEIVASTGYRGDFAWCMRTLMTEHPQIKRTGSTRNVYYIWEEPETLSTDRGDYSEMKNQEGYPDGTAGRAIANVMRATASKPSNGGKYPMLQSIGDVWTFSGETKVVDVKGALIFAARDGVCIGFNVYSKKMPWMKDDYTLHFVNKHNEYYASVLHPINVKGIKLKDKLFSLSPLDKEKLKAKVPAALGIDVIEKTVEVEKVVEKEVPVEVEKVVEKTVEVPVETIKEVPVEVPVEVIKTVEIHAEEKDIEISVLRAKCEIYEKLIFSDSGLVAPMRKELKQA